MKFHPKYLSEIRLNESVSHLTSLVLSRSAILHFVDGNNSCTLAAVNPCYKFLGVECQEGHLRNSKRLNESGLDSLNQKMTHSLWTTIK